MTRIAISYRRDDSAAITGRIFDRLTAHYGGDSVFRDIDNIPLGVDFREHINSILAQTDITLVVVGKRWSGPQPRRRRRIDDPADPVRVEVETALRNGIPVVPVLVDDAAMPDVEQLPDSLKELVYRNGLEVDSGRDFDQHIERLIRSMEPILARRAQDAEPARQAEEERQRAEAARQAEEERQRAEAARQAEEEKRRAEAARQAEEERQRAEAAGQAGAENQKADALRQAEDRQIGRPPRLHGSWLAIAVGIFFVITVAGGGYWLYTEVQQRAAEEKQGADAAQRVAGEKQRADTAQRAAEEKQRADAAQKAAEEKQRADAAQKAMVVPPSPENSSAVSAGVAAYDRKDYSTALRTLQPAAQAGDRLAQYYLGVMYLNGYGVPKKSDLALEWLSKAASAGVRDAQSYMGAFNRRGDLVPRNYEEAMRWYLLAAKQDYENSQYNIALMYYRGEGVKQDLPKAYMWAIISSMGGEPEPNRLRMKLEQSLSASEITEGQREAALWRVENIAPK